MPLGLSVGAVAAFQSGAPDDRLYYNEAVGAFVDRRAPRGCDPVVPASTAETCARLRRPDLFSLDLRLLWSLRELTDQDISLMADVFNAFGGRPDRTVEAPDVGPANASSSVLRSTLASVSTPGDAPFRVQLGMRVRF